MLFVWSQVYVWRQASSVERTLRSEMRSNLSLVAPEMWLHACHPTQRIDHHETCSVWVKKKATEHRCTSCSWSHRNLHGEWSFSYSLINLYASSVTECGNCWSQFCSSCPQAVQCEPRTAIRLIDYHARCSQCSQATTQSEHSLTDDRVCTWNSMSTGMGSLRKI